MDDEDVPFASHITKRGRIYQYVRRVPEGLADAFPFSRIQRSLRTVDRATAYEAGARVHSEVEKQFAGAPPKKGRDPQRDSDRRLGLIRLAPARGLVQGHPCRR